MTIPQFMLFSWLGLIVCGLLFYCVVDAYEPEPIPVIFDVKNTDISARDTDNWRNVIRIPEGLRVYLPFRSNIQHAVQSLGLERSDLSEDWVGIDYDRRYFVDIGDIYELEFHQDEYAMGHAWGYSNVDVKFIRDYWQSKRIDR